MTYVRWYWPVEDVWGYDELDSERWSIRHVEVRGCDGKVVAAASLAELIHARDHGGVDAVPVYENAYGIVPESPIPLADAETPLESVSAVEFERLWRLGRRAMGG